MQLLINQPIIDMSLKWSKLYEAEKLENWGLPAFETVDAQEGIFSRLYQKWSDIPAHTEDGEKFDQYMICSDVLVLDQLVKLDRATFIFARRIEVGSGVRLSIDRRTEPVPLILVAQEVVTEAGDLTNLEIEIITDSGTRATSYTSFPISNPIVSEWSEEYQQVNEILSDIHWNGKSKSKAQLLEEQGWDYDPTKGVPLLQVFELEDEAKEKIYPIKDLDTAFMLEGEPLRVHLRCLFQLATLLSTDHRELCIRQYEWVAALATASSDTRTIAGEARSLAARHKRMPADKSVLLVPDLDYEIYNESAKAFLELLKRRDQKQELLIQSRNDTEKWQAAARDALQRSEVEKKLHEQLLNKAKSSREKVLEARATVARQIALQRLILFKCEKDFEAGIKIWEREKIAREILKMVMGVFKMLSAIPTMVVTGPSTGISSVMSMVSGAAGIIGKGISKSLGGNAPMIPSAGAGGAQYYDDTRNYIKSLILDDYSDYASSLSPSNPELNGAIGQAQDVDFADDGDVDDRWDSLLDEINSMVEPAAVDPSTQELVEQLNSLNTQAVDPEIAALAALEAEFEVLDYNNAKPGDVKRIELSNKDLAARRRAAQLEFTKGIKEIGDGAGQVMDAAMNIVAINEKARKLERSAQSALLASNDAINTTFSGLELQGLDVVTGGEQVWDYFAQEIEGLFERNSVLGEIQGGNAYRKEMNKLILLGKTYAMTRLAVAKADAELGEIIMREKSSAEAVRIFEQRVKQLGEKAKDDATIAQLAFGKILDARRAVYLAMDSYKSAIKYYTLKSDEELPSLPNFYSSIDEFDEAGANITGHRLVVERLYPRPNDIPLNRYTIPKEMLPKDLFESGVFNMPIDVSSVWFGGMFRIRLDRVRVYLEGLKSKGNLIVNISTSGSYEDKLQDGRTKRFAASPIKTSFIYDANDPTQIRKTF